MRGGAGRVEAAWRPPSRRGPERARRRGPERRGPMGKYCASLGVLKGPWDQVFAAFWQRYPNPYRCAAASPPPPLQGFPRGPPSPPDRPLEGFSGLRVLHPAPLSPIPFLGGPTGAGPSSSPSPNLSGLLVPLPYHSPHPHPCSAWWFAGAGAVGREQGLMFSFPSPF